MKGILLQNPSGIRHLNEKTKMIVLRYRPSILNTPKLLKNAPHLKRIWISSSENMRTMSARSIAMIRERGIEFEYIGQQKIKILKTIEDAKEIEILESV